MITPPFLTGAILLFWGWQTGLLIAAVPMALVLEAPRFVQWRMDLSEKDFSRIWKVCAAVFLAVLAIVYVTNRENALRAFQWSPLMFFPIVAAQALSTSQRIESRVFFLWIRMKPFNLGFPFLLLAIGAACAAKERAPWFFPALAAATGWTLWNGRPARSSRMLWAALYLAVAVAGFVGAVSLRQLQKTVEDLYIGSFQHEIDSTNVRTALGDIEKRKQSNSIVLRAKDLGGGRDPLHLARASYNVYHGSSWQAIGSPMRIAESAGSGWALGSGGAAQGAVEISMPLAAGEGYLPMPLDTVAVTDLSVSSLAYNRLGAVKVTGGPGLATYRAPRSAERSFLGPPDEIDLSVPKEEAAAVSAVASELNLRSRAAPAALDTVKLFFESRFVYTLDLKIGKEYGTPLADFLLRTRAGHCEYFATAAVLLLRSAGIPARYAVGYLAHEYSAREDAFVVRSRDAHAWVVAYVGGEWRVFDPTPPNWVEEQRSGGVLSAVNDLWSYISFRFSRWRWSEAGTGAGGYGRYGIALLVPALLFLGWKIRKRFTHGRAAVRKVEYPLVRPGMDSPFHGVERSFAATQWERKQGETYAAWLKRLGERNGPSIAALERALAIHNRYRFDPKGISDEERRVLEQDVNEWLRTRRDA